MADDPGGQAIGIIGALKEAGLLRTAASTSEPAAQIIGALSEAGLLGVASVTPEPAPGPPLKVGDELYVGPSTRVIKFFSAESGGKAWVGFEETREGKNTTYVVEFPPNDESYLPEIDKIIAAPRPPSVSPLLEITSVIDKGVYGYNYQGKLLGLMTSYWFRP